MQIVSEDKLRTSLNRNKIHDISSFIRLQFYSFSLCQVFIFDSEINTEYQRYYLSQVKKKKLY